MSLLNKVLRDLDARHASDIEQESIPVNVKPLPLAPHKSRSRAFLLAAAGLLAVALLAAYLGAARHPAPPPPSVTAAWVAAPNAAPALPPTPSAPIGPAAADAEETAAAPVIPPAGETAGEPGGEAKAKAARPKPGAASAAPRPATRPGTESNAPAAEGAGPAVEASGKVVVSPRTAGVSEADYRRAANLLEQGQKAEAESLLRRIVAADPGNTQWAMNLARLQADNNDNAAAWETLQRSLPYAAKQGEYRAFCGTVLQRLHRFDEAATHYDAALRIDPGEGRWWAGYGMTLEADGKMAEAREAYTRARATGNLPPALEGFVDSKLKAR